MYGVCVYVYIHIYIYIYIHIYIYIYIHMCVYICICTQNFRVRLFACSYLHMHANRSPCVREYAPTRIRKINKPQKKEFRNLKTKFPDIYTYMKDHEGFHPCAKILRSRPQPDASREDADASASHTPQTTLVDAFWDCAGLVFQSVCMNLKALMSCPVASSARAQCSRSCHSIKKTKCTG